MIDDQQVYIMEKTLESLTEIELKARAYDTIAQLQLLQQNLQAINAELVKRAQAARLVKEN